MPLHKDLTGTSLHEPKGVASATSGTVYVADGAGSGAWTPLDTRVPAGAIQDFATPLPPSGWLECDGTDQLIATYPDLYTNCTIQQNGTRTNASTSVTGLSSTAGIQGGFYVFGTGIAAGTTVAGVPSGSSITLSAPASSSGTANVVISPWYVTATTIRLPDLTTTGRYRRTRSVSTRLGQQLDDQNKAHTHPGSTADTLTSIVSSNSTGAHTHTATTNGQSVGHTHTYATPVSKNGVTGTSATGVMIDVWHGNDSSVASGGTSADHTHTISTTSDPGDHHHTVDISHSHNLTLSSDGGTEARPTTMCFMTCIRT